MATFSVTNWKRAMCELPRVMALVFLAVPGTLQAQTLDYKAAQEIFGEPVTSSITGSPQRVSDVPGTMEIITADDIRRSGAHDIPSILRNVIGVDVLQWSNDYADVSVRGYNQAGSARLLVLVDGRQVYADFYNYTPWSTLPVELNAIQQIEVVKGPASALFGFNAVGGVVNIVTKDPLDSRANAISLKVGTQGLVEGSAVAAYKVNNRAGFRIELGGRTNDDFSTPGNVLVTYARQGDKRGSANLAGVFKLTDHVQASLEATRTMADEPQLVSPGIAAYVQFDTKSLKGQIVADTALGLIRGTAYTNWYDGLYTASTGTITGSTSINNRSIVGQVEDIFKVGARHTFRASIEYRRNTVNTFSLQGARVFYGVLSGGAMWEWKVKPSFSLTNAFRIDHLMLGREGPVPSMYPFTNADWDRTLTEESFNSGAVWRATELDTLRFTIGRGVQLPSLRDFGAAVEGNARFGRRTGVPTLAPTTITNYEIAWDRKLPAINAQFRTSVYHQRTDDITSYINGSILGGGTTYSTPASIGHSGANGVELSMNGTIGEAWRWGLGYAAERIKDDFNPLFKVDGTVEFQHTTPVHVVTANLGWTRGHWEVDSFLKYESKFYGLTFIATGIGLVPVDDYASIDGRVGYKITDRITLSLSGQNLVPSHQRQTVSAEVERRVFGGLNVGF